MLYFEGSTFYVQNILRKTWYQKMEEGLYSVREDEFAVLQIKIVLIDCSPRSIDKNQNNLNLQ